MSKRSVLTFAFVMAGAFVPVFAQEPASAYPADMVRWSIITAGFALGIASGLAALGQGRAVAVEHHVDEHGHAAPDGHHAPAAA